MSEQRIDDEVMEWNIGTLQELHAKNRLSSEGWATLSALLDLRDARAELAKLAKFKAYVHRRLDEAGVPADPDSPHKAKGCRIGGRLDIVLARGERRAFESSSEWRFDCAQAAAICLNAEERKRFLGWFMEWDRAATPQGQPAAWPDARVIDRKRLADEIHAKAIEAGNLNCSEARRHMATVNADLMADLFAGKYDLANQPPTRPASADPECPTSASMTPGASKV